MTIQIVIKGKPILFDSCDWSEISKYKWHVNPDGYARTWIAGKAKKMHRFLLGITAKHYFGEYATLNNV